MRQNNHGQTLVLFVLILPLLLIIFGFLVDTGNLYMQKRKLEKTVSRVISYGMHHLEEENLDITLQKQLILNLKTMENSKIEIQENSITISVTQKVSSMISFLKRNPNDTFICQKTGILIEDKIEIRG